MTSIQEIFNTKNWEEASQDYIIDSLSEKKIEFNIKMWKNTKKSISPLDLYKYLKSRFGLPKGMMMFTKHHGTTENLIHWHYHILSMSNEIHFIGNSSGLEVCLKIKDGIEFNKENWNILISNIKSSFKDQGKEMGLIQNKFEHYTLFINPFSRLEKTLNDLSNKLKKLNIEEPINNIDIDSTDKERSEFYKKFNQWVVNTEEAVSIGSTIRMLCPVLGESFVNLLILVLGKDEIKKDKRLYDDFLKRQIDVRIKSLHFYCDKFKRPIDSSSQSFKDFHTIMNSRNDFLHGNIDPKVLMFEDVYFDMEDTPLFKEDGGIISKTMNNYLKNVEPEKALDDYNKTLNFIQFLLEHLEPKIMKEIILLMSTRMPAINRKNDKIAVLFPGLLAEGHL